MRQRSLLSLLPLALVTAAALEAAASPAAAPAQPSYERTSSGTRWLEGASGLAIKMLVEEENLGSGEVEVGEITFPAGSQGQAHRHQAIEIFYVLSGTMEHVVNGEPHRLGPGMVAMVKPGDDVAHRVLSEEPVRALVIWAPGGEAERLASFFRSRPLVLEPEQE
jgi:quercetin dioxygenase-like cupin family protein